MFEDFEDSTITYTTNDADDLSDISNRDYFGRIASDTATPPGDVSFSNAQGTGYFGVQDSDAANSGDIDVIELTWSNIDTSNFENLNLSWFIAEDDATDGSEDWDSDTEFRIDVSVNGGGFSTIFQVASEIGTDGNETNEAPRVDTNFDGIGDGTLITDSFQSFNVNLANANTYDIRVTFTQLNAGDEDFAFDNLRFTGTAVPEPAACGFLLLGLGAVASRRRRS